MNKEFIEKQLKLSKRQNKDERYDYLCSEFNAINYCVNLEKYTNKLQQKNSQLKERIEKAIEYLETATIDPQSMLHYRNCLLEILKEVE